MLIQLKIECFKASNNSESVKYKMNVNVKWKGILINFSKTFSTVDHNNILQQKIIYDFSDLSVNWFSSHLTDRKFVQLDNVKSQENLICCGGPQEYILGPNMFI